jgi:hypothetical protein
MRWAYWAGLAVFWNVGRLSARSQGPRSGSTRDAVDMRKKVFRVDGLRKKVEVMPFAAGLLQQISRLSLPREQLSGHPTPAMPRPFSFSTFVASACAYKKRNFFDLATSLNMPVGELLLQCNGHAAPSKALMNGLAKKLDIDVGFLERLADEVRKDF